MAKTLYDKLWESHVVRTEEDGTSLIYIDRHLLHEVTSPQAFEGLELAGRKLWRNSANLAVVDHNVPTTDRSKGIADPTSRLQVETLDKNAKAHGLTYFDIKDLRQGIVHVIGPEQGATLPGMTVVCGDSHTSTHGAIGALAFGIGTSEVEHVMATQCLLMKKAKNMLVRVEGTLGKGVSAKDVILAIIGKLGTAGGNGYVAEFCGEAIRGMTMEGRMTLCNMSIEMGARGGMIAPDETTINYVKGREFSPKGEAWDKALAYYKTLKTDDDAVFDKEYTFDGSLIEPMITYGTNPGMGIGISKEIPDAASVEGGVATYEKSLNYMGFGEGEAMIGKPIDYVFIGSCTNGRIEDFRAFASIVKGRKKADNVTAWLVPGSHIVEAAIKEEGLLDIFTEAGFVLRQPGCSACLAMNDDKIPAGKYAVSTSNRNFEGRQGPGSRTLLASPLVAAAAAVTGKVTDPRELL